MYTCYAMQLYKKTCTQQLKRWTRVEIKRYHGTLHHFFRAFSFSLEFSKHSSLNRRSLITTAFTVWVVEKFAPVSFSLTACSSMTHVSSSVLHNFFISSSVHHAGVDTFSFSSGRSCFVFREMRFFTARLPKSVWLTLS